MTDSSPEKQTRRSSQVFFWFFSTLIVGFLSIHNQSFWIDEGISSLLSRQDSLASLWELLQSRNESDIQMPLYVLYSWGWEKIFGWGEIASRASNIPLLFIGSWFFRRSPAALVLFLFSPLLVYYAGEFRVYASQIVVSVWIASYLLVIRDEEGGMKLNPFYGGLLVLCSISLLGVVWSIGAFFAMLVVQKNQLRTLAFWKRTFLWAIPFVPVACYYGWILLHGANPARIPSSLAINILQSCYEVAGFTGFGPGRLAARESISHAIPYIPWILLFGVITGGAFLCSFNKWRRSFPARSQAALAIAVACPFLLLAIMWLARDFRFSGRHCTPLFGYYIVILTYWFGQDSWFSWSRTKKGLYLALATVLAVSSFNVRFSPRFEREDYRGSVDYVNRQLEQGRNVIWIGVNEAGLLYNLNKAAIPSSLSDWEEADEVVFTTRDLYDESSRNIDRLQRSGAYNVTPLVTGFSKLIPARDAKKQQ